MFRASALALAAAALAACSDGPEPVAQHWDVVEGYCFDCHNSIEQVGDLALDALSPEDVGQDAATWEKVLRKLRGGLMPPPGGPRPAAEELDALVASLEHRLGEAADSAGPRPGRVGLHRLNRTEYANAVRDLLGVRIDAAALLPRDNSKDGYDNNASALTLSPTFLEQYVAAARTVAMRAVGDPDAAPGSATYVNDGGAGSYKRHIEGLPLGTRGGMAVIHDFPADGEYLINVADMAAALWVYDMEFENTLLVTLDGREIYRTTIGGEEDQRAIDQTGQPAVDRINQRLKDIRFDATAGPHQIGVTFLARSFAESDDRLDLMVPGGGQDRILEVESFEIQGPFAPTGVSDTPARRRVFSCRPQAQGGAKQAERCAAEILSRLARRAYRRPVGKDDVDRLLGIYRSGAGAGADTESFEFEAGVRKALTALLASPEFLFRFAAPPEDLSPGADYVLNDFELASRLSFFLWSSIPDDELLDLAEQGRLSEPGVLDAQVRRMLADERARVLVTDFAFQWLDIAMLDDVVPDPQIFPHAASAGSPRGEQGDPREAYEQELSLFLASILLEDRSVLDLLDARHTYLNETVALLYGIDGVRGDQFRRVELEDSVRFGLLGKGAVLMATSYPNRTAPVLRGKFILENLMGSPPSPPPPGVDTDLVEDLSETPKTVRERLELHRKDPSCTACHAIMDPLGLTLENFNAIGEWRERDRFAGIPIDASGTLAGGEEIYGPDELRDAL
ncbi:MAG: DUF1592 domain-containing protein, partial [Gammaproteobacteria bacterium]|nr:DUF1592 domain-containing protein [Gammaproteobacteria bacterium]